MKFNVHKLRRDDDGIYRGEGRTENKEPLAVYGCIAVYHEPNPDPDLKLGTYIVFHLPSEIAIHRYYLSDGEAKARKMAEFVSSLDGIADMKPARSFRTSRLVEPDNEALREAIAAYLREGDNFF